MTTRTIPSTLRLSRWATMTTEFSDAAKNGGARILTVRATDNGTRLLIKALLSNGERIGLCAHTSRELAHLSEGEIDAEALALLWHEDAVCRATDAALRTLMAGGVAAPRRLMMKLTQRGFSADVAKTAVIKLIKEGYVNEEASALAEVRKSLRLLRGNRRILEELHAKGYGKAATDAAARLLDEKENDSVVRCATLLAGRKYAPLLENAEKHEALLASLFRYGYTKEEIEGAIKKVKNAKKG